MNAAQVRGQLWIGGEWVDPVRGQTYVVDNPATGEELAEVAQGTAEDVERAYQAALAAYRKWRTAPSADRVALLRRILQIALEHVDELALLEARDSGNPLKTALADIRKGAGAVDTFASHVVDLKGETFPATDPNNLHITVREPYGVVGQITPFNHPLMFVLNRIGAAVAAGNATIVKPPEQAPLSVLRFAELMTGVIPPGLVNILTGGAETGAAIVRHPEIRRIAFTGGVDTGLAVLRTAAESGSIKRVSLELGGKNPIIVLPDADLVRAAAAIVQGMNFTRCQGQSCGSTSRLFLHEDVYDQVMPRVLELARQIQPGLPELPDTEMGPVVSRKQFDRVMAYVAAARDEGARLVLGGTRAQDPALARGYFVMPTVFEDVTQDMRIAREEIFGPVLSVIRWRDYEQMLEQVNGVRFGLTASIWTENLNLAIRTASAVEAGYVWVNGVERRFPGIPFGGYKDSGMGQEHGLVEVLSYTREKAINFLTH